MRRLQFCLAVFAVLALTFSAFAQVQNGQFAGTVTDPSGAAVPNAKVTVVSTGTNLTVSATTNQSGNYIVKELPIGTYKLTAEASGFKTESDTNVVLNAGVIAHVDFKLQIGKATEVIEVTGAAVTVQTDDAKLYSTVSSTEISNTVLSGRDIFDLMQLSAGAVNVAGTDFENGHNTVVNGVREDFNGFLINGVSNKGLSGGEESTPINDSVEEFQELGLNMSAQYGNSAGSTVNLVTKGGTNALHGSAFEYLRNEDADANDFFANQAGTARNPYRWNQFGGTVGGPIIKDKLFFFLAYEKSDFKTSNISTITQETSAWRSAVAQADANGIDDTPVNSVASLLYGTYTPKNPGFNPVTIDSYIQNVSPGSTSGFASYADYLCPDSYGPGGMGGSTAQANAIAARMQSILGVVPTVDNGTALTYTGAVCSTPLTAQAGTIGRDHVTGVSGLNFQESSIATSSSRSQGNFFNGRRMSGRLDYNWNTNNRLSANFQWQRDSDEFGPCSPACDRGFSNPQIIRSPNAQFSFTHTFSPTILNEFKAGYVQNVNLIGTNKPGVPLIAFDDGSLGFGSYNGYPQYFRENIYSYSDMVSLSHGNHNMKIGADVRRNIENSQFSVARGSYYFSDPIFFAADSPYGVAAGVNPEICAPPCSQSTIQALVQGGVPPSAQLAGNVRHWRNVETGAYFQDDWKATKRLTLQLGLRWDLYVRHNEEANTATTFILGPGSDPIHGLINANVPAGSVGTINGVTYDCTQATNPAAFAMAQVQGVCGPGGFAPASSLGKGRHKDFGPRLGFAWDVFGDGKTSLRGGFGISYEGTLYNPLSNSRWNLPYYSFNNVENFIGGDVNSVVYGPTANSGGICTGGGTFPNNCVPNGGALAPGGVAPTGGGPGVGASNPGQGSGAQATGNINGWNGSNPNLAELTGIIFPQGVDDPYIYNYYLGFQREIMPKTVLEVDFVGTTGHKLFRAENINRLPGTLLPAGSSIVNNVGETLTGSPYSTPTLGSRPNPNYGTMRAWENVVNSNYSSMQASLKRQMSHGLLLNVNYTYSHSIDNGSTWHSGATTSNGASGGDGYTTDPTNPEFDRGNSVYDVRHRLVVNHVWQMPGHNLKGAEGAIAGGWSLSGIWAFQTGAHWQPFNSRGPNLREINGVDGSGVDHCTSTDVNDGNCENLGGDYLLDRGRNERPDSSATHFGSENHDTWANGWCPGGSYFNGQCAASGGTLSQANLPALTNPCFGCLGNLGRNTFVGPNFWSTDLTLSKAFKLTERFTLKFDAAAFNVFNRANFLLATAGGGGHNEIHNGDFGKAGGTTINGQGPRTMQFGLKFSF
jgi:hypothetical protein